MQYVCPVCGYVYDEDREKVPFDALPADWRCPLCKAPKAGFSPKAPFGLKEAAAGAAAVAAAAAPAAAAPAAGPVVYDADRRAADRRAADRTVADRTVSDGAPEKLSRGAMAALFSNLARGCEKQYKPEAAALAEEIAEWFAARAEAPGNVTWDALAAKMQADIAAYPGVRAAADAAGDRGAARSDVWGEKVTRMLLALTEQYRKEGEAMLAGTEVWVCTACGFVWIGEAPPEACPVCKVPSRRFEKSEGR